MVVLRNFFVVLLVIVCALSAQTVERDWAEKIIIAPVCNIRKQRNSMTQVNVEMEMKVASMVLKDY